MMKPETAAATLASYAVSLRPQQIGPAAMTKARHCLIDALGCAIFGRQLPWSRIVLDHARETAAAGPCTIPGEPDLRLQAPQAALVLGALAHAFELDSLRKPGAGVHPGATVAMPALAVAEAVGADDRTLLAAIVAGCEVMFRIGAATYHSPEKAGFHAPGLIGPFGSAVATGYLLNLCETRMTNALALAGSMGGGLLAFAGSGQGGMVKRLHLGRAAEAGVVAAMLASRGYEGPSSVLEGKFGLLDAYCETYDAALLTAGLGEWYEIEKTCFKQYACHITAHAPVQRLRDWMAEGFTGDDIAEITIAGREKLLSHHANAAARDVMMAQYSVPFTVALAAYRDPADPNAFSPDVLDDPAVTNLARRVRLKPMDADGWAVRMRVALHDGRVFEADQQTFLGTPDQPFEDRDVERKFRTLCRGFSGAEPLLARFQDA